MPTSKKRFMVLSSDISCYHVPYIEEGINRFLSEGNHEISFFSLGIEYFEAFFNQNLYDVGAIGISDCQESKQFFKNRQIPYLNLTEENNAPEIGFFVRYKGEGHKAARFFIEDLQISHLGYFGNTDLASHKRRLQEFSETAESHQLNVQSILWERTPMQPFYNDAAQLKKQQIPKLAAFLKNIPKPAGIFCANDKLALIVKVQAELLGISIPKELNILGVGSLYRASGGWEESVSVIQLDHTRLGYESARLMEQYMLTGITPDSVHLNPENIIHRNTTLRKPLNDLLVRRAIKQIQNTPDISIKKLCDELSVSRRTLESHFHDAGAATIGQTIDRERFNRAQYLIKNFRYNMESIAALAGYKDAISMRRSFFRLLKMSPMDYRRSLKKANSTPQKTLFPKRTP